MVTDTDHSDRDDQSTKEPEKVQQEQEPSQQQQDNEKFQLLVDNLFDQYEPETSLEEAAVIRMARALWMRRDADEKTRDTRILDQQITTALRHLSQSKAMRRDQESSKHSIGSLSRIRGNGRHWGLIRRPVGGQARAHLRCWKEAMEFWAPHGVGKRLSPTEAADLEDAKDHARWLELDRKKDSEGFTPDEEIKRTALEDKMLDKHPLAKALRAWGAARGEQS